MPEMPDRTEQPDTLLAAPEPTQRLGPPPPEPKPVSSELEVSVKVYRGGGVS